MNCVSIFSGAGGLDVGAKSAGANITLCVENDPDAARTLKINAASGTEVLCKDIQEVDFRAFKVPGPQILIGGPPCQPFSKNGYWVTNDKRLIDEDPRNMLSQFLRAVRELQPEGFLFENVESILHPTNRQTFLNFIARARRSGYTCDVFRANSADFGVPQKRKRVFVFGRRGKRNAISDPIQTHADKKDERVQRGELPAHVGVARFIDRYAGSDYQEPQECPRNGTYYAELTNVPPGKNYIALSHLPGYKGRKFKPGGRFWNFLHKLHPDDPSITIAAQPGPWVGPFHWDNRRLRAPEVAAIQTFPEWYQFHGSRRSVQKQIGNAVPCKLGEVMVAHLIENI